MYTDVVDLREFYHSALGRTVERLLRARLAKLWPQQTRGERVVALGYGLPILRLLAGEGSSLAALMPAEQGVAYWPREGPNVCSLIDTANLPLADNSVDRIILMHALEGASDPNGLLREIWRVMKGGGHMLMIVANRRGLWAHSDRTPFGTGQPYSAFQIKDTLRDHGFLAERVQHLLYMPPSSSRVMLSLADAFEKYSAKVFPGFGGLMMIEAGKQLYAPTLAKKHALERKLILPYPMTPAPSGA